MVVCIKIFNERERIIKKISCKTERIQKVLEENNEMISTHYTTIEVIPKFIEVMWDKRGTQGTTEECDGINSFKIGESSWLK